MKRLSRPIIFIIVLLILPLSILAGAKDPISGEDFDALLAAQLLDVQHELEKIFPEAEGFFVTGPLDPFCQPFDTTNLTVENLYESCTGLRVLCADLSVFSKIDSIIDISLSLTPCLNYENANVLSVKFKNGIKDVIVRLSTIHDTRALIWKKSADNAGIKDTNFTAYSSAVWDYLKEIEEGHLQAACPRAIEYGLAEEIDFYAPPPDYVIQGYQNYKDFLKDHAAISTDFAKGVLAFVASDSLLNIIKQRAPREAYPNKEAPMLQDEFKKFFERGGSLRVINTLSKEGFDTLQTGEYFFAVGLSGKIRFGRELLREEVDRIEKETGLKVPRANHAFLFPGEPILTAGAFFIKMENNRPRISEVNAQSGHYFYSNVSSTIREDVIEKSDYYLFTLGHFLTSLDSLGIPYNNILIGKFNIHE